MHRGWRPALVATLLVLAGCAAVGPFGSDGAADGRGTLTPAPVPSDTPAPTPRAEPPRGLARDGVVSASLLATRHRKQVAGRSYVWRERYRKVVSENGSRVRVLRRTETMWVASGTVFRRDLARVRVNATTGAREWYNESNYANGSVQVSRARSPGPDGVETSVQSFPVVDGRDQFAYGAAFALRQYLQVREDAVAAVERGDERWYRVVGTGSYWPQHPDGDGYRVVALVDPDGVVHEVSVRYAGTLGGRRVAVTYSYRYERFGGVTVPRPAWYPGNESASG